MLYPGFRGELSWGFDGADQINSKRWAIKGKGGALLQEKLLAARCKHFVIIVDSSKVVPHLGAGCPVPVEIIPEGYSLAEKGLKKLGATELTLRTGSGKHGPVITERGNIIVDAAFPEINESLERDVKQVLGVVDSGLFIGYAHEVLVGGADSVTKF